MDDHARFERYCDGLTDVQLQVLHRIVARRTAPIYQRQHGERWKIGYDAARARVLAARRG